MNPMYVGGSHHTITRRRHLQRVKNIREARARLRKIHTLSAISGIPVDQIVGRAAPHYSKALRRRLMSCRADCESNLGVSGGAEFVTYQTPQEILTGCNIGSAADIIGISLLKRISRGAKTLARKVKNTAKKVPGVAPATKLLSKVLQNPIVDTIYGQITVPANVALGLAKGGPKGAIDAAKKELRNPVRRAVVSAAATIFPPAAPAAVALNAANVMLDAYESKDPVAAAKAAVQIASIAAGAQEGIPHMKEIAAVVSKAKVARDMIQKSGAPQALASARELVCGAKSEDARGAWFKLNTRREGSKLVATLYAAAGGHAEIATFSVDLNALMPMARAVHARLHNEGGTLSKAGQRAILESDDPGSVSGMLDGVMDVAKKLGTQKIQQMAASKTNEIARRAGCKVSKPPAPVSDAALATYAAARAGVEAVDNLKRVEKAVTNSAAAIKKYGAVKGVLGRMTPAAKAIALQKPEVRKAVIDGVAAKGTAASFVNAGGVDKLAELRQKAALAQSAFRNVAAKAKAGDPQAKKIAAVVSVAARARADVQSAAAGAKGGLPGLVVGPNGVLRAGRFSKAAPKPGESTSLLLTRQGQQAGVFAPVSGLMMELMDEGEEFDLAAEDQLPFELQDDTVSGAATKVCCYGA